MTMASPHDQDREKLRSEITALRGKNNFWGGVNFQIAQVVPWLAICASFATTVLSTLQALPKWAVPACAAVSGIMIAAERTFNFAKRATWHHILRYELYRLENELKYEDKTTDVVSKELSRLLLEMERRFPAQDGSKPYDFNHPGVHDVPDKKDKSDS